MKRLLYFSVLVLSGCSVESGRAPQFQKDLATTPLVAFVGDSITYGWLQYANHPMWVNDATDTEETCTQMHARFAQVIAQKPDVIHLLCGTWDMEDTTSQEICDYDSSPCDEIGQMVAMAQAAGIPIVVATIPPWGVGPLSDELDSSYLRLDNIEDFNVDMGAFGYAFQPDVMLADYHGFLAVPGDNGQDSIDRGDGQYYVASLTNDGVNPNQAGYDVMTQIAEQEIGYFHAGGEKRTGQVRSSQ